MGAAVRHDWYYRCNLLLLLLVPAAVSAQQAEIRGRVVEFGGRTGLSGVTVELDGAARRTTPENGQFSFSSIPHGRHRLSFRSIGYQPHDLEIDLRGDTTVVVELEVAPVRLDSVTVRARNITLRGKVRDPVKDIDVVDAEVLVGTLKPHYTNINGTFKVERTPANSPQRVEVRALGYLPEVLSVSADRDTTISITLEEDPLARRFIAEVVEKLEVRSRGVNASRLQYDPANLEYYRGYTLAEFLRIKGLRQSPPCFFVDDVQWAGPSRELVDSYFVEELQRVEVYDRGLMVRIYTARYLQKNIGSKEKLRSIVYMRAGRLVCM